ncbi:hypothetical protein HMPREF9554_02889 [Treponema phagedenis F0421]|nr:hypothetical protein HMPREF9554_02889 [Treponema phagedenis F0421]
MRNNTPPYNHSFLFYSSEVIIPTVHPCFVNIVKFNDKLIHKDHFYNRFKNF